MDIRGVVQSVGKHTIVKVILETAMLTREEKIMGSTLAKAAGADYVKTSTGYGGGGATVEDVQLMRETVGPDDRREGVGRDPHEGGRRGHGRRRRDAHRRLGRRQDRARRGRGVKGY